jgi:hypothetical protein
MCAGSETHFWVSILFIGYKQINKQARKKTNQQTPSLLVRKQLYGLSDRRWSVPSSDKFCE